MENTNKPDVTQPETVTVTPDKYKELVAGGHITLADNNGSQVPMMDGKMVIIDKGGEDVEDVDPATDFVEESATGPTINTTPDNVAELPKKKLKEVFVTPPNPSTNAGGPNIVVSAPKKDKPEYVEWESESQRENAILAARKARSKAMLKKQADEQLAEAKFKRMMIGQVQAMEEETSE